MIRLSGRLGLGAAGGLRTPGRTIMWSGLGGGGGHAQGLWLGYTSEPLDAHWMGGQLTPPAEQSKCKGSIVCGFFV